MKDKTDAFGEIRLRTLKTIAFIAVCLPAAGMLFDAFSGRLVEPIEELTHRSGEWSLRLLLLTLAITPLRQLTGWGKLVRFRRLVGVASFCYMLAHFGVYLVLDRALYWPDIIVDLTERPYIIAGFSCLLLCLPLALTSTDGMLRRLGGRIWKRIHKLVYPATIAAVLHFIWLVKADLSEPLIYTAILAVLLAVRLRKQGMLRAFRERPARSSIALG